MTYLDLEALDDAGAAIVRGAVRGLRRVDRMLLNIKPAPPSLRADNLIEASRRGVAAVEMAQLEPGALVTAWWGGE